MNQKEALVFAALSLSRTLSQVYDVDADLF